MAYRLGMVYPDRFAGVVSLNGCMPRRGGPLLRLPEVRKLRVFIGHGIANAIVPLAQARQDHRLFYSAGLNVQLQHLPLDPPHPHRDAPRRGPLGPGQHHRRQRRPAALIVIPDQPPTPPEFHHSGRRSALIVSGCAACRVGRV